MCIGDQREQELKQLQKKKKIKWKYALMQMDRVTINVTLNVDQLESAEYWMLWLIDCAIDSIDLANIEKKMVLLVSVIDWIT